MDVSVPGTLLAFDDTDCPDGMCTTYLAALVLEELSDLDLVGLPRLVRLNPNVPWKTRGNAAICLQLGKGEGVGRPCGEVANGPVRFYESGKPCDPVDVLARASKVVERMAQLGCEMTNPGVVASNRKPPPALYWQTVREVVDQSSVERLLAGTGAVMRKFKNGRGVIGAAAAMSWRPRDRTWEVIAYRAPGKFGTPREIDPASVVEMDKATRHTFNNYDYENGHIAIAPGSPCPILFGIRGDSASELLRARKMIRGERPDKWLMFLTNQGTEDHIVSRRIEDLSPWTSARISSRVLERPRTIPGGHVVLRVGGSGEVDAMFYEPSRGFRDVARALLPGDRVTLHGSVRDVPRSLNVEKMHVDRLVRDLRKVHNPKCEACGKSMGSLGKGQGYRCKRCGAKADPDSAAFRTVPRAVRLGWSEPPVASRRHLHKPLRRMSRVNIDNL